MMDSSPPQEKRFKPAIDNGVTSTASEESGKRKTPLPPTVPTIRPPNANKPPTPPLVPRQLNGNKATESATGYKICSRELNIKNIIKLLITGLHPISFLEDSPFRDFWKAIFPDYSLPSTDKVLQTIKRMYDSERTKLMKELTATSFVSLSIESWKSNSGHIYTTIRGHFVDSSWELKSHVISIKPYLPDCASPNFELNDIAQLWGIKSKVHTVTSELKVKHNFPAIPSLSLLPGYVTIALNESSNVNKILEKARSIFEYFGKLANEKVCLDDGRHQFFPEFFLLDSILQQKAAIQEMLVGTAAMDLTKDEWSLLDKVVDTLKPFDLIKQLICGEAKEGEASLIKPLIHTLCENFLGISHTDQSIKILKMNIRIQLLRNYKMYYDLEACDIFEPDFLDISAYVDPRFKSLSYLKDRHKRIVWQKINATIQIKKPATMSSAAMQGPETPFQLLFPTIRLDDECARYNSEPEMPKHVSPFQWWKERKEQYPLLSIKAVHCLCTRASSKPIYPSASSYSRRAELPQQLIEKYLFLNNSYNC